MARAILYYSNKDFEYEKMVAGVADICKRYEILFSPIEIEKLKDREQFQIKTTPNLIVGPYNLKYPFTLQDVEIAISAAQANPEKSKRSSPKNAKIKNSIGIVLSKVYPSIIAGLLALFIGGAFLAPVLMENGKVKAASTIYHFYRIFCHQLAFRSFFIFGEQPVYPRELAHVDNYTTYEQEFNDSLIDIDYARTIVGNQTAGYKIALCERDLAIYSSLALLAILFQLSGRKIKPIRWYVWFIVALIPIGIDGFSQIPGLSSGWPSWVPIRESTPFLRVFTGTLFGGMTGWYMFPLMEESMKDTNQQLITQREIINAVLEEKKRNEKS
jgi:uncharacterized membrane protein